MSIQPEEKTLDQQITERSNSSLKLPPISPLKTPREDRDKKKEEMLEYIIVKTPFDFTDCEKEFYRKNLKVDHVRSSNIIIDVNTN